MLKNTMVMLTTNQPEVELVPPEVERDAPLAVRWLEGDAGRDTLRLMGNPDASNRPSTLEEERERIKGFIASKEQLTWAISFRGKTVGAIWVNLTPAEHLAAPAVHIMIGDPETRGQGVGLSCIEAVIAYMKENGNQYLYSRHLVSNTAASKLLERAGFSEFDNIYTDADGLVWQNRRLQYKLTEQRHERQLCTRPN
jgi:RimJ/RimL family protein N-acetyltransferase